MQPFFAKCCKMGRTLNSEGAEEGNRTGRSLQHMKMVLVHCRPKSHRFADPVSKTTLKDWEGEPTWIYEIAPCPDTVYSHSLRASMALDSTAKALGFHPSYWQKRGARPVSCGQCP
eukprot:779302-Rhodomonas_salina.5